MAIIVKRRYRAHRVAAGRPYVAGKLTQRVSVLWPRNLAETRLMVGFAIVTGISEEIYFRLALPLLLLPLTGNVFWVFGIAAMIFGAFHLYQGARGVILTAIVGLYLSAIYVGSGQL